MAEMDAFERRLGRALVVYADEMRTQVDAVDVAERVTAERSRRWWSTARLPAMPRLALLLGGLLLALFAGLLAAGGLVDRPSRIPAPLASGATLVAPSAGTPRVVAGFDSYTWAAIGGRLVRVDSEGGDVREWDLGADLVFVGTGLAPARDGGVWLYGRDVIRRFDGVRLGEALRLPVEAGWLWQVLEAPDGTLWASTGEDGLLRFEGGTWRPVARGHPADAAGPIALDAAGSLWLAEIRYPGPSASWVSRLDGTAWTSFDGPPNATLGIVSTLVGGPDGTVWGGNDVGLLRFDGTAWNMIGADELGSQAWVPAPGVDGDLWVASGSGPVKIARFHGGTWTTWTEADGLPGPAQNGDSQAVVAVSGDGAIAATHAGLFRLDDDRWYRLPTTSVATVDDLLDLEAVSSDEAWGIAIRAGTGTATEVLHFSGQRVTRETVETAARNVRDLALGSDGTLWAATDAGLWMRSDGGWTMIDPRPVVGVAVERDGRVWTVGDGTLSSLRRDGTGWVTADVVVPDGVSDEVAPSVSVDRAGQVWISGGSGWLPNRGLYRYDGEHWSMMAPVEGSDRTVFGSMAPAPDGTLWVTVNATGTDRACCSPADPRTQVAHFDGQRWVVYGTAEGLPADNIELRVAVAPDGTPVLSTTRGLYRLDGDRWMLASEGYPFGSIAVASDGTVWASGWGGVMRLPPER